MPFTSFSCLIFLANISSTMLNMSGKSGPPGLAPNSREKAFNLSLLSMVLVVALSYMAFIMLRYVFFIPNLLRVLS